MTTKRTELIPALDDLVKAKGALDAPDPVVTKRTELILAVGSLMTALKPWFGIAGHNDVAAAMRRVRSAMYASALDQVSPAPPMTPSEETLADESILLDIRRKDALALLESYEDRWHAGITERACTDPAQVFEPCEVTLAGILRAALKRTAPNPVAAAEAMRDRCIEAVELRLALHEDAIDCAFMRGDVKSRREHEALAAEVDACAAAIRALPAVNALCKEVDRGSPR